MASFDFNTLSSTLNESSQKTEGTGVSFAGKSLKLNGEDDVKQVADAIEKCGNMQFLDLEGNTLGPDAAEGLSKAIEKHGTNLKRALWKDLFTGRMKDEIPVALEHLGRGLCAAKTQLVELDLSDNAFGPIGVKGLASLLSSSPCYTLQQLRLNNNGLGISGGKLLAKALLDCNSNSLKETGKPLALKVFIAGRNRLENEGATVLSEVFKTLKTLEEVVMPQNGIYHVGISALANSLSVNKGLRILNLNDNTVGPRGAVEIANILHNFNCLEQLNLGDCLLKTRGAIALAEALKQGSYPSLTEINLSFNEIKCRAASVIAEAMSDKTQLASLILDGNIFGKLGREELVSILKENDKIQALGSMDEDEEEDSDEENSENEDEEEEEEEEATENDETKSESEDYDTVEENPNTSKNENTTSLKGVSIQDFLKAPTGENFLFIQNDKAQAFSDYLQGILKAETEDFINESVKLIMKVSALYASGYMDVRIPAEIVTDRLYKELFEFVTKNNQLYSLNNSLLVNLGLLKGEDKKMRTDWNLEGCFKALEKICQKDFFTQQTRDSLKVFIEKSMKPSRTRVVDPYQESKSSLKSALDQIQST
ncbi:hypothetical protein TKK_0018766 [Trichogramma kaykai]|uniref:Ran-GTPase activating protein 1 C-terminal domain-containing protein n=1 Tax=Trichogramma kaykai TaxID=54128 RepID=A0ABD2VWM2_9HYME